MVSDNVAKPAVLIDADNGGSSPVVPQVTWAGRDVG